MVTAAVSYFRPLQAAFASADRDRAILAAAGLIEATESLNARQLARRFGALESHVIDLRSGVRATSVDARTYDFDAAAQDDASSDELPAAHDPVKISRRPHLMPVYIYKEDDAVRRIVLPVYGQGMWSTIKAYVALDADYQTIRALVIDEHGETPGIGDRIENPAWLAAWAGIKPFGPDADMTLALVEPGMAEPGAGEIDAIAGATVTAKSLVTLVGFWLGDAGYGPYLKAQRAADGS